MGAAVYRRAARARRFDRIDTPMNLHARRAAHDAEGSAATREPRDQEPN